MTVQDYRRQIEAELGAAATPAAAAIDYENIWDDALKQLKDATLPAEKRLGALTQLQAGAFLGARFAKVRPAYLQALRAAATDAGADIALRRSAMDILVSEKDDVARRSLIDGLNGKGPELVEPAVALSLLATDDHGAVSDIARDLLKTSGDIAVRAQAVRVLGADPKATPVLDALMSDKDEFREVRRVSAVALRGLNHSLFEDRARKILADAHDFKDIKLTVGGALERGGVSFDMVPSKLQD